MNFGDLSAEQARALMERIGGKDGAERLLSGEWIVGAPAGVRASPRETIAGLLEPVRDPVSVVAPARFVAREAFVVGHDGELPLTYVGEDFSAHFLGLVEEGAGVATLTPRALVRSTIDAPIFAALGGESDARIALAHLFAFLKTADRNRWYFFYVADTDGKLWAVDSYWRDGGWDLEAYSVTYPRGWRGGGCVVSH